MLCSAFCEDVAPPALSCTVPASARVQPCEMSRSWDSGRPVFSATLLLRSDTCSSQSDSDVGIRLDVLRPARKGRNQQISNDLQLIRGQIKLQFVAASNLHRDARHFLAGACSTEI